jgi:hypothetical protein
MIRSIARGISLALLGALSFAASVQAKVKPGEVQPDSIDVDAFDKGLQRLAGPKGTGDFDPGAYKPHDPATTNPRDVTDGGALGPLMKVNGQLIPIADAAKYGLATKVADDGKWQVWDLTVGGKVSVQVNPDGTYIGGPLQFKYGSVWSPSLPPVGAPPTSSIGIRG